MDGLIVGKISTFFKKKKFIYDSHEFFAGYKTTNIDKKIYYLEKFFLNKNDIIIAVSNSVAEKMFDMYKPKTKVNVIRNIPIFKKIDQKNDLLREEFGIEEKKCILLYQGLLIERRRLDILICAIEQMSDKYVLVFIGKGSYKKTLENLVLEKKLENRIFFKDFMENQILLNYTNSADIGIFLIGNDSLSHYYCLPNKIFEFIQGEIPIVTSNFPDLKDLVVSNKLGLVTDPNDLQSIKDSIEYIEANKSDYINSLKNIKPSLSWENEEVRLLELYKNFID
jgi:glycosyltransferase involved in cell wall biosynthesis